HLKDFGIGYDKFVVHGFDETLCDEFFEFAKFVKSIDPKIRLFANSFGKGPKEFMRFHELIDIWDLQDSHCERHPQWLELIKSFGQEVWTYECLGPAKANNPYSYYRLMPWRAFKRGQTGAGFWVYHDGLNYENLAVPWDDTLKPYGYYGVIYGPQTSPVGKLDDSIVPSRRWEAWREGVEDYQYLFEVQKVIDLINVKNPSKASQLKKSLNTTVDYVLSNPEDCNAVYQARRELTEVLLDVDHDKKR
ncbi:MAG: DUF4091 domain-containing protein, partial [Dehalococcoidia bacterium]|nr:DUF4091 domain-containing protein [Dehalococcoidia bacterium]